MFGKRDELLRSSTTHGILHPIPIRTKFHNYKPTISTIIRSRWERVADNPVLSRYFSTAPFSVWINHCNLKGILSYKQKSLSYIYGAWTTFSQIDLSSQSVRKSSTHHRYNLNTFSWIRQKRL